MSGLLNVKLLQLKNSWQRGERGKLLLFLLLGLFFVLVLGFFFLRIFGYLQQLEDFPYLFKLFLAEKLLTMVFLTLFTMLLLSALLSSLDIFFLSRDLPFLFSSPMKTGRIFFWKLLEAAANSSAMVLFFSLPVLFSYCRFFAPGGRQVALVLLTFLLFIICGVLLGVLAGLIIPAFFSVRRLQPVLSVFSVVLISFIVVFLRLLRPERFLNPQEIDSVLQYMGSLDLRLFRYFPFSWAARSMTFAARGLNRSYGSIALLFLLAIAFLGLAVFVLQKRFYLSLFDKLNRGGRGSFKSSWKKKLLKGGFGTLWEKEIKTFLRTPAQWSQLLVIGALVVIFVLNLKMIPLPHPAVKNMLVYLNLALTVFIIAGLNSRFTFPSIPVEGHGLVHLVASPFGRRTFYDFKLIVHLFPQLVLALLLLWIGDLTLGFDPFTRLVGLVFTLPLVTLLTVLALYFGVHSREIAALSPQHALLSRSGIAYMLWSMITIAACLGLLARPVFLYYYMVFLRRPVPHLEIGFWLGGLVLLNGLAAWLFYSRGKKLWLQREF